MSKEHFKQKLDLIEKELCELRAVLIPMGMSSKAEAMLNILNDIRYRTSNVNNISEIVSEKKVLLG